MEFIQGTVTHCRLTTSYNTSYITLFRVDGRPVELRTPRPTSLADGDQIIATGPRKGRSVEALACRNLTTQETATSDFWGHACLAVIFVGITVAVDVFCYVGIITRWLLLATPILLFAALLCVKHAWLVRRAARTVNMAVSHGTVRRL